jgi:hypothetical protein
MSELKSLRISDSDKKELVPDSDDAIVYDPYFASILNENREVSIEGLRVRIIEEGVVISKNENLSDALKFVSRVKSGNIKIDEEVINTDNVTFFPEYYLNPDKKDVAKSRISATSCPYNGGGLFGHNHECFQECGGGTFRIKGRVWSQSFAVYASMGHETKHQRKRLGLWFGRDAEYIESKINTFEVEFEEPNGSITIVDVAQVPPYNFNSINNHDRISRTFDFQTAVFTIKPPFIYKLAKARKLKKYNTNHKTVKYGTQPNF